MAQRVVLTDDLDGSEATQTVNYTIDGQEYEIDLSEENVQRFHEALEPFVSKSRQVERQARVEDFEPFRGTSATHPDGEILGPEIQCHDRTRRRDGECIQDPLDRLDACNDGQIRAQRFDVLDPPRLGEHDPVGA